MFFFERKRKRKLTFLMRLILGSSSKFRQRLLRELGYLDFEIMVPDIDEKAVTVAVMRSHSPPDQLVLAIARAKAEKLKSILGKEADAILITCDQVVVYQGQIREKPESKEVRFQKKNTLIF
jgi:septum formation protein